VGFGTGSRVRRTSATAIGTTAAVTRTRTTSARHLRLRPGGGGHWRGARLPACPSCGTLAVRSCAMSVAHLSGAASVYRHLWSEETTSGGTRRENGKTPKNKYQAWLLPSNRIMEADAWRRTSPVCPACQDRLGTIRYDDIPMAGRFVPACSTIPHPTRGCFGCPAPSSSTGSRPLRREHQKHAIAAGRGAAGIAYPGRPGGAGA
jgi:hypothetical protein